MLTTGLCGECLVVIGHSEMRVRKHIRCIEVRSMEIVVFTIFVLVFFIAFLDDDNDHLVH